ncbi:sushi, von Willebrand factor type A, EGF and pentraxin domain-containing protein 1-like isoform X2 [Physella acuta]|uniref:sushi, von Willebrand factor type A, EGF and pentraxin domain-containing protein 1-like isoform X2 n=1 Tax=Physella acuta TaxID=109671 RepID=UPI0027DAD80F|nr:sushi, von Willebrand factor type A, EGF and pentraxin domain-containing protein 1-like isoform X2 [Physella acuta]
MGINVAQTQGLSSGTYFLEGTHKVTYIAKDNRGGMADCSSMFTVIVRSCSNEYTNLKNGKVSCQPQLNNYKPIFGSECEYKCDDGYEISGSSNAQCNENQQWSVQKPFCRAIACAAPPTVENGKFTGCLGGYPYMSKCILTCKTGYVVDITDTIRCLSNRSWTVPGICRDIAPPVLNCGAQKIEVYAGPKLSNVPVQWPPVTAVDNSNFSYPVESDIQSGAFFDIGVITVTFTAEDKQKNIGRCTKTISVIVKRCPPYEPDENANVSCSHSNAYGSVCTSVCNDGYLLVGADSQTCQENKTWSGSKPTCISRDCGSPPYVAHGNYTCLSGTKYKDVCTLNCDPGFQPVTPTTILCTILVEWTQGGYCKDTQPPTFPNGCTHDLEVIASAAGQPTYVSFTLPVAVDNSGDGVIVKSEPVSRTIFAPGSTKVTVTATDTLGLQSKCSFFVVVKTISCDAPNIDTSGKNLIRYNCSDQYVFGSSCDLSCMNGNPITGPTQIRCEKVDGNNSVQWKMEGNSRPICDPKTCSKLRVPNNGALSCDLLGGGSEICTLMCNENYSWPYQDPFQFSCVKGNGTWSPGEATRDCVARRKVVNVETDLVFYYYTGTCSSDSADIKGNFVEAVSSSIFRDLCSEHFPCTVDTVSVSCGIIARRRKRDTSSSSTEYKITATINIGEYKYKGDAESTFKYYDDIVMGINYKVQAKADAGLLNVPSIGTFDMFEYGQVGLKCEPGTKMVQRTMACAGCGTGYIFNNETESCQACPVGTYQDQEVAFSCTPCPVGKTTKNKGSTALNQCLDLCTAGSVSQTGIKPCQPCPTGTYQSAIGMTLCNKCPYGTSTTLPGQTSQANCKFYDVKLTENSTGPVIQIFDAVPKRFSFMTWISDVTISSLNIVNNNTAKFSLDQFVVNIVPETVDSNRTLRKWNHVALTYSSGNGTVYLNGQQIYFSTGLNFTNLNKKSLYFKKSKDIPYIVTSGIQMTTTFYSASQIKEFSLSCTKQVDKQVLAPDPFGITLMTPSSCSDNNFCSDRPCGQNGVCVVGSQTLTCLCDSPWSGDRCQNVTNFCADNLCANGSSCISRPENKAYTCACSPGFYGVLCNKKIVTRQLTSWGAWSSWSKCSSACGSGERTRTRQCNSPGTDGCLGGGTETEVCKSACQDCQWSEWVTSPCSGTCGDQQAIRTRNILQDSVGDGMPCRGLVQTVVQCNLTACPVNGNFGAWSEWSQCSATCGGGTSTRRRLCDNPPPSNGGEQCDSSLAVEKIVCNAKTCPECKLPELRTWHTSLNCSNSTEDQMLICNIVCAPGTMVIDFENTFTCGAITNYTWSHQTIDNPTGLLPDCTEMKVPIEVEPTLVTTFAVDCNNKTQKQEVQNIISEEFRLHGCIEENSCYFDIDSAANCSSSRRRSIGTLTVTINLSLTRSAEIDPTKNSSLPENYAEHEIEKLINLENLLNQLVNKTEDGLILFLGPNYPSGNVESVQTKIVCQKGSGYYNGFCVDCPAGSYSDGNGSCVLCDKGYFQEQPKMSQCNKCPGDTTTSSKGSYSMDQCTNEPVTFQDIYPNLLPSNDLNTKKDITVNVNDDHIALISGLTVGIVVGVVIVAVVMFILIRKHKRNQTSFGGFNKGQANLSLDDLQTN